MHWEKKICIRITVRRIMGAILAASTVANLVIVGAVLGAEPAPYAPTMTSTSTPITPFWTATLVFFTATVQEPIMLTATETPYPTPTETFTPTQTAVDPPLWIACLKKFYWPTYRVQAGDTLFSIAARAGSSVDELMQANCRTNDQIYSGELLYVPRLWTDPITITPTPSASPTGTITQIPTDTPTATQTPTDTPTYTPSIPPTDTPTATPSATPTDGPLYTPTATPTASATPSPTGRPIPSPTPTDTPDFKLTVIPGVTTPVLTAP